MAIKLTSKPQTIAISADYPFGDIRDTAGSTLGTPVNRVVYADFHQFFEKLMNYAGVVHNGSPDNETNGFQLFEALLKAARQDLPTLSTTDWAANSVFDTATFINGASAGGTPSVNINAFRSGGLTVISGFVRINCDTATTQITTPNQMFVELDLASVLLPVTTGATTTIRGAASGIKNNTDPIPCAVLFDVTDGVLRVISNLNGLTPTITAGDFHDIIFSITYKSVF
jgi:hypothetical protein